MGVRWAPVEGRAAVVVVRVGDLVAVVAEAGDLLAVVVEVAVAVVAAAVVVLAEMLRCGSFPMGR